MNQLKYTKSQKSAAHQAVARAVKTKRMERAVTKLCISCGKRADFWHHHEGYEEKNKLNVVPICRRCHPNEHNGGTHETKLSDDEVRQARKMHKFGMKIKHIAIFFDYAAPAMGKIVKGESYKWVK